MVREGSFSALDFAKELLRTDAYKPNQGQVARKATMAGLLVAIAFGVWRLSEFLKTSDAWGGVPGVAYGVPLGLLVVGLWVCFRVNNYPKFADFLISVEGEMHKVSWPVWPVLLRSSWVVILLIFFLAFTLFVFDVFWRYVFALIGVNT